MFTVCKMLQPLHYLEFIMQQLYLDHGIVMIITKWVKMVEVQKQHAYKIFIIQKS